VSQVNEAEKKGLKAVMVNEDTASPEIWASLRQGHANLYYVSPEMALSSSFTGLWQDRTFRNRVQALVIDEAHCIVEWGDDFRPQYSGLAKLRDYIGQDTPIIAATATCDTESFNVIWKSLKFGCRPFWGIDVGTDRSNLVYITRIIKNPANPLLDIINIFPAKMDKDTPDSGRSGSIWHPRNRPQAIPRVVQPNPSPNHPSLPPLLRRVVAVVLADAGQRVLSRVRQPSTTAISLRPRHRLLSLHATLCRR
jgi:superfamily II DNA helicase RecQ